MGLGFWSVCRQTLPHWIMEGLPVARLQSDCKLEPELETSHNRGSESLRDFASLVMAYQESVSWGTWPASE